MTAPVPPRPRRRWTGLLVVVAAVAVGLGTLAALGGFERRPVRSVAVAAGSEIDAGNLVFRFDSATVQYFPQRADEPWEVVALGSVRNPHDETLSPLSGDYGNLVAIDRPSDQFIVDPAYTLGADGDQPWGNDRRVVPPVDAWLEVRATFRFGPDFRPAGDVELGVVPMEYTVNSILGLNEDPTWNPDSFRQPWTVTLPATRLPDDDY